MEARTPENKSYLNYGVITGVVLVLAFLVYYLFDLFSNRTLGVIPAILYIVLIIIAQIRYARQLKEGITFGNLFAVGFKTAAAATAIYLVFLILFILVVPSYKSTLIAKNQSMVGVIGLTLVMNLIRGVIAALIGAAFGKKNPQP